MDRTMIEKGISHYWDTGIDTHMSHVQDIYRKGI